ncbi:MAG TPA: DUF1566 domain-containing protein [Candidatus Limnocylindrales bacterium]|nr:DUF1566 domain-containing protein [Candidatus Limnocylindrales bacterium]
MAIRSFAVVATALWLTTASPAQAYLCGDLNGNKAILAGDALIALQLSVGLTVPTNCGSQHGVFTTGQDTCYDDAGDPISCEGTGQDGEFQKGASRAFIDNGDGTVTDRNTGLQWEQSDDGGGIHDQENKVNWLGAFLKIAQLNVTMFAGHSDWRVPNIFELMSLGDFGQHDPGYPVPYFQHDCAPGCAIPNCACIPSPQYEWSSTSYAPGPSNAWALQVRFGDPILQAKSLANYTARAVRGGYSTADVENNPAFANSCADVNASDSITAPDALAILRKSVGQQVSLTCLTRTAPLVTGQTECYGDTGLTIPCIGTGQDGELQRGVSRSFANFQDGTIGDETTGLVWEVLADDGSVHDRDDTFNFSGAQDHVDALNESTFAGVTNWRRPNFNELASLFHFGSATSGVYDAFFNADCENGCSNTQCSCAPASGQLWSSTTFLGNREFALRTDITKAANYAIKADTIGVRAVTGGN